MNPRAANAALSLVPAIVPTRVIAGDNSGDDIDGVDLSIAYFAVIADPGNTPASAVLSVLAVAQISADESATLTAKLQDSTDGETWADVADTAQEIAFDGAETNRLMLLELAFQPGSLRAHIRPLAVLTLSHEPGEEDTPDEATVCAFYGFTGFAKEPAPSLAGLFNAPSEE